MYCQLLILIQQLIRSNLSATNGMNAQMLHITVEQEATLRRWASSFGKPRDQRDKDFLKAEKGLSEEQIDFWFKKFENGERE